MNNNIKNFCKKVKEHKTEIIVGGATLAGLCVLGYFGIKNYNTKELNKEVADILHEAVEDTTKINDLTFVKELSQATVDDSWMEDGNNAMLILNDFRIKDIGLLGEDMIDSIEGVTEDTELTAILGVFLK